MSKKIYKHNKWLLFSPKFLWTWPLFFLLWLIARLPFDLANRLGFTIGGVIYKIFPKRKYIVKTNLKLCFPDKSEQEIDHLVKHHFQSLICGTIETAIAWYGPESTLRKLTPRITIENENILKEYLAKKEPLILITPHAVNQELLSKYLSKKYTYIPVFRHMNNPVANYLMQKARLKIYHNLILKANTRSIIRTIQSNSHPLAILPDQDFGRRRSVFAPFFGVLAATTTSLSKYKKLTNANMIVISYRRQFDKDTNKLEKFIITVNPPLEITGDDYYQDAVNFNTLLETIIQKDISMYFWVAKKFKTRPLGEPKLYNYISVKQRLRNKIYNQIKYITALFTRTKSHE